MTGRRGRAEGVATSWGASWGAWGRRVRRPGASATLRAAAGGTLAVALVAGGIAALQALVPPPERRDGPVVRVPTALGTPTRTPTRPPATTAPPARTTAPPGPAVTATAAPATPSPTATNRPSLTVLNNSRVNGLAARAARDFEAGGWDVTATGNLRGRTPRTTVYYDPGHEGAAAALRRQFPRIRAAAPRPTGMPGAGTLTVVVTRDYAA